VLLSAVQTIANALIAQMPAPRRQSYDAQIN
jgi:hypothetical protein